MGGVVPDGEIPVAVIQHGAVVAGEDHQGVFFQTGLLQSLCNAAHTVIQFHGHVTAHAVLALAHKAFFRAARHVDVMRGEHQEKRFLGFGALLNVFNGLIRNYIGVFLILPQGAFAALHESDASDSVDNGLVVSVAPHEFELVLIVLAIGKPGEVVLVGYFNGVVRVQVADIAVFQNHTGNAVARSGEDKALVKSDFVRAGGDMFVPVNFLPLFPQAQVPFAYHVGFVAVGLEHLGQGGLLGIDNEGGVSRQDARAFLAPRIFSCEQGIAGRGADGCGGIGVREAAALLGKLVDGGGGNSLGSIAAYVSIAEVVSVNHDDGLGGLDRWRDCGRAGRCRRQGKHQV